MPTAVPVTTPAAGVRDLLRSRVEHATRQRCLVPDRSGSREYPVFHYPPDVQKDEARLAETLFEQFASEIHSHLASLRSLVEAEARRKELEEFIDRFKHALSSPLQGISDRIASLRQSTEGRRVLTFDRLKGLVADLREFSVAVEMILDRFTGRIRLHGEGSLRPQLNFSQVDPVKILSDSVRKLARHAARREIQLKPPTPHTPPLLFEADPDALSEVFDNLIENAVKFAREGSHVSIQSVASSETMHPPWQLADPGRRFVISDRGLGIHPDDLEKIFLPYVQGRAYLRHRVIGGSGLGLAICKQIAEAHGGAISITCRPQPGSESRPFPDNLSDCLVEVCVDLPFQVPWATDDAKNGA